MALANLTTDRTVEPCTGTIDRSVDVVGAVPVVDLTGPATLLDVTMARHLLRRTGHTTHPERIRSLVGQRVVDAVAGLLGAAHAPVVDLPVTEPGIGDEHPTDLAPLQAWWVERMATSDNPVHERMVRLWHDLFPVDVVRAPSAWDLQQLHVAVRTHALGRFPDLLAAVVRQPAMREGGRVRLPMTAQDPLDIARAVAGAVWSTFAHREPSDALVADLARTMVRAGWDLSALVGAVLTHPDFYGSRTLAPRCRTTIDHAVTLLRATGLPHESIDTLAHLGAARSLPFVHAPLDDHEPRDWSREIGSLPRTRLALAAGAQLVHVRRIPSCAVGEPDAVVESYLALLGVHDDATHERMVRAVADGRVNERVNDGLVFAMAATSPAFVLR